VRRVIEIGILMFAVMGLSACGDSPDSDVVDFIEKTKKKESKLQELPEFKKPMPYFYESSGKRDPFLEKGFSGTKEAVFRMNQIRTNYSGPSPDFKRKKEILEEYSLDDLSLVGVISRNNKTWALIRDNAGIVHRVGPGNYLGQNYGKVINVNDEEVTIDELIPDGEGGWISRRTLLKMQ
jgi:type IV pilus assembly protein PilP